MAKLYLVEASPWNPASAATVAVRLAGGGSKPYSHLTFADWMAGVVDPPAFVAGIQYEEQGWTGGAVPQTIAFRWAPAHEPYRTALAGYHWKSAPITIKSADDEANPVVYTTEVVGTVAGVAIQDGVLVFTVQDLSGDLAKPVLVDRFLGTGAIEGDAECKDRIKRRTWGRAFNVEGFVLKKASNIYEFSHPSYPLSSFDDVRDMGRSATPAPTVVAWAGSIAATLTALDAVTPASGTCAVAPSIACVKWWTQPHGPLTADLKGEVGAGYLETGPEIASRIVGARSAVVTMANLAAATALRPDPAGLHVDDESESVGNALDRLLMSMSMAWTMDPAGALRMLPFTFTAPVETLISQKVNREAIFKPTTKRLLGYARNHRQHGNGEISAAVLAGDVIWADIDGDGKPDSYATSADNMIANSDLVVNSDQWLFAGAATLTRTTGGAGDPSTGLFNFAIGNPEADVYANNGTRIPILGATKLYLSGLVRRLTGNTAGVLGIGVDWYTAANVYISSVYHDVTPATTNVWTAFLKELTPVANAARVNIYFYSTNVAGAAIQVGTPRLAKTEPAADVTLLVSGDKTVQVAFDYLGVVKSGQLPLDVNFKLTASNSSDVTTSASWAGVLKSGTATFTPTVGSPNTTGTLNVTAMSSDAVIEMQATYGGKTRVGSATLVKNQDAPPVGGGAGGSSDSDSVISSTSLSTHIDALAAPLVVVAGAAGQVACGFNDDFHRVTTGNVGAYGKWRWRVVAGSYADVATEIASTVNAVKTGAPEPSDEGGVLSVTQTKTGLTNGVTYEFMLQLRGASAVSINHYGTASAVGS